MFMVYFAHSAVSPWHCLLAVPPLMCLHGSKAAIARADWSAYVVWHTLWHVAAVSTSTYIMYLANGGGAPMTVHAILASLFETGRRLVVSAHVELIHPFAATRPHLLQSHSPCDSPPVPTRSDVLHRSHVARC